MRKLTGQGWAHGRLIAYHVVTSAIPLFSQEPDGPQLLPSLYNNLPKTDDICTNC